MTAPQLPEARLRELAAGATLYGHERDAMAAELLAARQRGNELAADLAECVLSRDGWQGVAAQNASERDAARAENERLTKALESLRNRCSQQRAEWLKESRGAPSKMIQASCAMAAGSFGTVLEWVEEAIAAKQPKPVAWPHLPEADRPASEVQP